MLLLSLIPKELMQAQGARINTSAHVPLKGECVINPPLFPPNLATCEQRKKNQKSLLLFASMTTRNSLSPKNISSNQLFSILFSKTLRSQKREILPHQTNIS